MYKILIFVFLLVNCQALHKFLPPTDKSVAYEPAKDTVKISSNEQNPVKSIYDLMKSRYTVRTFKDQNLEKGHLDQILKAGLLAPSKNKLFPYKIIVLTNSKEGKSLKQKLWSQYTICYHCSETGEKIEQRINSIITAPVSIMFFLDIKPEGHEKKEELFKIRNRLVFRATRGAMISATAMMLQAEQLGYGTAFTGVSYDMNKFKKQLKLSSQNTYLVTLSIGYKKEPSETIPTNYKAFKIDFDCQKQVYKTERFTVVKYSNKRNDRAEKIPAVITRSIDIGPKNTEKTHLLIKY